MAAPEDTADGDSSSEEVDKSARGPGNRNPQDFYAGKKQADVNAFKF